VPDDGHGAGDAFDDGRNAQAAAPRSNAPTALAISPIVSVVVDGIFASWG
jgi:hypothetical protein